MSHRVSGHTPQVFEVGPSNSGIFLFQPLLICDCLLLNVLDIHRPAHGVIGVEIALRPFLAQDARQQMRQVSCIMDPAVKTETANRVVNVSRVPG